MATPYSTPAAAHALTQSRSAVLTDQLHPLLSRIADGPRIQRVFEAFTVANAKRGFATGNQEVADALRATMNSPELLEWMPRMGYKPLQPYGSADTTDPTITTWFVQAHQSGAFIESMRTTVKITVTRPSDPMAIWSSVVQRIDLRDIVAAVAATYLNESIYDTPTMVAWAVHKVATTTLDFPWEVTPTGLTRSLPPWLLRTPSDGEPRSLIMSDTKGTRVPCHAWVIDVPLASAEKLGPTVFLSVAGSPALIKMTKANWSNRSNRQPIHQLPHQDDGTSVRGAVNPQARWIGAAVNTAIHGVYADDRILTPTSPHFYHVTGADGVPDWTLLFDQLTRCLLIPIDYQDIESLWATALSVESIVTPLKSYGCQGYRINVDCLHNWAVVIGHATGRLVTVDFVGRPESTDEDDHDGQLDAGDLAF